MPTSGIINESKHYSSSGHTEVPYQTLEGGKLTQLDAFEA